MEINLVAVLLLLMAHFIGDFVLQSENMIKEKSSNYNLLLMHVSIYMMVMIIATVPILPLIKDLEPGRPTLFILFIFIAHFAIDCVTSMVNNAACKAGRMYEFFVGLGAEQWIHCFILFLAAKFILGA